MAADEVSSRDVNRVTVATGVTNDSTKDIVQLRVDPISKKLLVEALSELTGHAKVGSGSLTITTAGTRVQLPNISCKVLTIQASETNTEMIVLGGTLVVANKNTRKGIFLTPTQSISVNPQNLNQYYIDAVSSGDSINYVWEN